ncbi:bifunctional phosphoribosylaminoimidazolecarboxamide formyltransferase/IMP cyclohydrolase [Ligilactobacillus cholophilus]|uniref:bifunctional phosphoribosylaminoimidazolecarboxamide formyltransferase/IMP cyclohydrolase n=1 Tax=Ligilactobacillus cholophilus TaxID=3050131 RepID=UPI0025B1DE81|nr:bifunctional phosphoribosylaminoimidazolecarboxamide formyltransferase/IMP cyclohydrolase [Ligilactobacillus cholophilus]
MKKAIISVSDKTNLLDFAKGLTENGFEIISTGGTQKYLNENGIETISIEEVTDFPEILDGRVKTLHPKVHGGILAKRDNDDHLATLKELNIDLIDLVCVNLYPFKKTVTDESKTNSEIIEQIDIGGPSMLRSAAKNYQDVTVVTDQSDYEVVLDQIKKDGHTSLELRQRLAAKVFQKTAAYDALISSYFNSQINQPAPQNLTLTYNLIDEMRYGENSQQKAWFYEDVVPKKFSICQAKQLHGKKLSFNNIKDADAALRIIREFDGPTAVGLKHMNPCGIGKGETIEEAWDQAYLGDPVSIFGGIVALNRPVDVKTAEKLHKLFLEIIIAPSYDDDAYEILAKKKNLRLLTVDFERKDEPVRNETVSVMGGLLVQEQDFLADDVKDWKVVTKKQPTPEQLKTMEFAWKAVKFVKSNAILVANPQRTLGVGAGQPNRIDAVKIAIEHAQKYIDDECVLASDAFFPMNDSVEYAAKHGIKLIVQPGGSIRDQDSIDMADKYGIAMVMTGRRHFRH